MGKDLFNDRISRFSIRKLNVGVCSVLLGTLVMVGTASQVSADETANQVQAGDVTSTTATVSEESSSQTAVAAQASTEVANILSSTETNSQSQTVSNASSANSETSTTQASSETTSQAASSTSATTAASTTSVAGSTSVGNTTGVSTTASVTSASSETPASETASEAQGVDVQAEASTTNALSSGAEASAVEQPVVTAETSGRRRTRRALGNPNDESLIGDDVEDATSTPKVEKPGFTTNVDAKSMASQISWLDFGDVANWTGTTTVLVPKSEVKPTENLEEKLALQVGSTYTKEIMPGYVVTVKVKSLKPFQATEIYKKRMENQGATEAEKATYDPNAKNGYVSGVTSNAARQAFNNGEEAKIVADAQNNWTEIRFENIDTKTKKTTISSALNGGNIGVQFEISATFRGKTVKPAIVMADGESANPGELVMFTTNGEGWQHIGEWKKFTRPTTSVTYSPQDTENLFGPNPKFNNTNLNQLRRSTQVGPEKKPVAWKYFGNPDKVTGGLGTGIFGPNISEGNYTVPIVMTRGASEVGLYVASGGKQSAMLGFFPIDEGDAPESYGKAMHTIATVDGITGAKVNQPYIGNVSPDMDENTVLDWFGDDKATTADEGIDQLLPDELKGTTNEMIKMDRTRPGNYKLSIEAHTDGASEAYIYGWIDFNQNGTFDEDERSDLARITNDGTVELTFANSKTYIDPSVKELGARVRIAKKANEIESPTGMALSGEVEDFRTQITHPPKGEFKETSGPQGAKQTATVTFTARGEHKYELNSSAVIDEMVEPYIVDKDGNRATLDGDGYYVVPGQGKYKITANGKDVDVEFIPEDNFLGTADGISIRRSDNNGYDTGWSTKFPDQEPNINGQLNTMDGQYVPTVTPIEIEGVDKTSTDVQGATQKETPTFNTTETNSNGDKIAITPSAEYPAKLVDPATGLTTDAPSVTVEGEGTYTINPSTGEVTFTPDPSFTGTAKGVEVTLSAPVGRNKDGKIQQDYIKTATAKYTPTVTPITVTPTDKVSADVQNVPQTQTPTFDLSNDKTAEITSKKLVDPATGQPTDETTVTVAGEGSYTIDPTTGAVTFTPEKDFVGTAKGVTVQATATITNANGKTATITSDATYTPTVVAAVPTAQPATSKDVQGATQTGTPTFAGTTVQVNGEDKAITIKDNSYTLLDNDGNEVTSTPAYAADGTTEIGTYSIDSATGQVTFTPTDKSYTGVVTPAKVQAESSNGIKVDTTYTPEIVPVTPTATPAETEDIQGATQTGKPEFKGGTVTVDGVEKTVAINEAVPATFDDGSTTKTVDGVGTYTVAADGTVTFVPEKSFVGTAPAVTVVREDKNGTKASATYTPTVTPVTPTATPVETTDIQGATQTGKPVFTEGNSRVPMNDDVAATFDDGSTTKTVDGVGTYTVAADGTVTFVPEKSFTGTAPAVTVVREDMNGTKASATYTPTVTPVTPTAEDTTSTGKQGQTQTGKPKFTEGNSRVPMNDDVPATFDDGSTTKTVDGVGTYTVASDGTVTFVPEKSFTGKAPAVTVVREDKNGTKASATYTPTVTPVTPTATPAESTGPQGLVQTGTVTFTEGDEVAPIDKDTITLLDENGQPATSVVAKSPEGKEIGTFTVDKDTGVVTFTPTDKSYSGDVVPVKVQAADTNGTTVETTYTPKITPVVPTSEDATSTDIQGQTQTGKPTFTEGNPNVPIDEDTPATFEDGSTTKTVDGEGTYTVSPDGTVTFVPEKSFTGTASGVTVKRVDKNGTEITAKYTPTVTPVTPTAAPVESTDIQGATQTGKPEFTEGDSRVPMNDAVPATFDDGSTTKTVDGVGTYTVAADGTVTFVPEKSFVGTAPAVTVVREDKNGTKASATYTPTVTPVTPTATPAETTGVQGATQSGKPTFTEGNNRVPMNDDVPATFDDGSTSKTVDGVGTYTVAADGTVTFVPEPSFTGTAPAVTVVREDKNGTKASATYTPTVNPVTLTPTNKVSEDIQNIPQTETPTFALSDDETAQITSKKLIDPATGQPTDETTVTVAGEGTYTIDPTTGAVTFTPEKDFVGTATGVKIQAIATITNEDGKTSTITSDASYTPTVVAAVPTAKPATSKDIQGATQTGTPTFEGATVQVNGQDKAITIKDNSYTLLDKDGNEVATTPAYAEDGTTEIGTYSIDPATGQVTFTPTDKSYTGKVTPVKVQAESSNGIKVDTTYTPEIVPVTPTATPAETTDIQGATQTGKPEFKGGTVTVDGVEKTVEINDDVPATFDDGSTTKTVDGVGTYTVAADGTVTFTPEKSFTGKAPAVTVVREDKNGTKASATYTPTVTPVTPTATPVETTDIQGATQTGKPVFTEGDSRVPMNDDVPATFDDGSTTKTVDGVGTYTVAADGTVTFVPEKSFVGTAPAVTVVREDKNGTKASATYTPTVTPVTPTAEDTTSTGKQGQTQTGKPEFTEGDSRVPMNDDVPATFDDGSTTKTVDGVGTYTVASDGTVTFVPEKSFTGEAPAVTVVREDMNGTKASATYTPTVTPVNPTATPAESTGPQGLVQTGTVTFTEGDPVAPINKDSITLLDESGQPAASVEAKSPAGDVIGTFTVDKETGVVTFTPTDKSYSGDVVPVKVQAADANGTTVETTYTPKITPVVPTSEDATSTDIQGQTQSGKPTFIEGDPNVPIDEDTPATFEDGSTTKTVDGEGTYTVSPDGTVTFVPEKSFTGTATGVTVKRVDKNGTEITAKYTPTVTPVTPTAAPAETTDIQGATQTGKPEFTAGDSRVPMNDDVPATFDDGSTTKTVDGVGTYTVAADGTVTFVPEKSFTGKAPAVTVVREDKNGTKASATYTPTVTPVTPTAEDTTSTDKQGQTQTGTPTFTPGNPNVPMDDDTPATFEDGSTTKNIPGEGTYTVAPDGTVTFVPEKSFTGTGTGVTVKRVDKNGTPVTAKYTPTVTPVTPTATPAESEAPQGVVQTGTVTFTEGDPVAPIDKDTITLLDENGQPAASVDAKSPTGDVIGTFTVDKETGVVTFTPTDKSYSGEVVPVKVQAKDTNGTVAETTYTPKITPVVPTADPATSTDIQGKTQTGTPSFKPGNPAIPMDDDVPATFEDGTTTKTIPGEGTYTVAPDGTVTFVPEKSFTGTGTGVTVKRVDKNGTPVTATYTPTVTPVTPTAEPTTSTGKQGQTQTGKPEFTEGDSRVPMNDDVPATFEDGSTTKTVDGVGTYTVAADGTVTFVPEKSFVGTAPAVTVVREDVNGTKASATYTPTVTPVTPTATPAESTGPQGVVQTGTVTFTEGDSVAPIDKDTITLLDENGQPAAAVFAKSPAGNIIGTFTVDKDTGVVTFTPTDKSYSGDVVPVKVQAADANGTTLETTYTPKITPVVPTSEDATSTDIQGATQTGKPSFTEGDSRVPMNDDVPATFDDGSTTKTLEGVGTYTVASDGTVTFVPEKSFVGEAPAVTVVREDKNGTKVSATYTPTVTPVTPTAAPTTSTDIQGATQTGKPKFTEGDSRVPMNDDVPATFDDGSTTKTVEGVGTYTVAADGTVTFVPEKSFVGEAPAVTVIREDKNGTKASATYTPTVTPVTPTAAPATSTDIQGQTQTGKPSFTPGNPSVPMDDDVPATFEDGSTTKVIPGEGTYTVSPDGTVTFVPEKAFTGTGTGVTVKRVDKNGTAITATYTPTVTPVTPTAESVTSIGNKGQTQTGKPSFTEGDSRVPMNNQVPATFEDGSTTKTISGVGTYTVAADGTVTFTPEPEFTGTAPAVTVVREDVNGTKASATYTPTVLPITKFVDKEGKEIPGYPTVDGEQPKVEIPGYRFVETKKLPNGDIEHVYEQVTTSYVDENGTPIPGYPTEDGQQPKKEIPGYEFVKTVVDENGNTQHIYKQIVTPTPVPDTTPTPEPQPAPQTEEPKAPVLPETKEEAHFINPTDKTAQLPETGSEDSNLAILGLASLLAGFGLYGAKRRKR